MLSNEDYEGLLSKRHDGVMTSMIIRKEVYEYVKSIHPDGDDDGDDGDGDDGGDRAACPPISENDLFCEIIKMNYGKGSLNPVDGPTAFYRPKAPLDDDDHHGGDDDHDDEVCDAAGEGEGGGAFRSMSEQDRYWSVGVMPQGSSLHLHCLSAHGCIYSMAIQSFDMNNPR